MKTSVMVLTSSRATHLVEHQWILFGKEFLDDKGHTLERHMAFWGLWRGGRRGKGKGRRRKKKKYKRRKVALWAGNVWVRRVLRSAMGKKHKLAATHLHQSPQKYWKTSTCTEDANSLQVAGRTIYILYIRPFTKEKVLLFFGGCVTTLLDTITPTRTGTDRPCYSQSCAGLQLDEGSVPLRSNGMR